MWLLGKDYALKLDGENVSVDTYFGFMTLWIYVKVKIDMSWCDAIDGDLWFMRSEIYVEKLWYDIGLAC